VLVVGPTGSGKTTTLHAILAILNTEERKILTAEDPVEITQNGLQQVQVLPKAGLTFAVALRSFLRCDPDVILIGEMRDHETAGSGIEASLTGHLVFSTLHTNSAPETIIRLLDIGLDPMNFADALVGVVAQRLVRTLCGKCKQAYKPDKEEIDKLRHFYGEEMSDTLNINWDELELYKPSGCEKCGHTGYRGRMGIHEVLMGTGAVKKLVARAATVPEIRDQGIADGMRTLQQDGIEKIFAGHTDLVQVRKVAFG
jgi:type II secretory ATPase GspE/PulE/Tfp pilus assembly ATPase PilB-like protein